MQQFLTSAKGTDNLTMYLQKAVLTELREVYGEWISADEEQLSKALAIMFSKNKREKKGFIFRIVNLYACRCRYHHK